MKRLKLSAILSAALSLLLISGCPQSQQVIEGPAGEQGPPGAQGPAGPVDPTAPPKPTRLCVFRNTGQAPAGAPAPEPHAYQLRWNFPDSPVAIDSFIVYESETAIAAADQQLVTAVEPGAARATTIELFVDSGKRHFRVSAVSYTGVEGSLSDEYVIDTTSRVVIVGDLRSDEVVEIFSVIPGSSQDPVPISGSLVPGSRVVNFAPSPDGRREVFVSNRFTPGVNELFVTLFDGSGDPVRVSGSLVTGGSVSQQGGVWSPDGTRIAFLADKLTQDVFELFVAPADGSAEPVRVSGALVSGGDITSLSRLTWSPDGENVAFLADKLTDGVVELFVGPADGSSEPVRVSGTIFAAGTVNDFNWSPDGKMLGLGARESSTASFGAFIVPADASAEPLRLTSSLIGDGFAPGWSPEGKRLAFQAYRDFNAAILELFVSPADGSEKPIAISGAMPTDRKVKFLNWSPEGTRIAFLANKNAPDQFELYVNNPTGGLDPLLLSGAIAAGGTVDTIIWSPDGLRIAFMVSKLVANKFELFVARPEVGGEPVKVSGTLGPNADVMNFSWSPDGSRILMVADRDTDDVFENYVVSPLGGFEPKKISGPLVTGGDVMFNDWSRLSN